MSGRWLLSLMTPFLSLSLILTPIAQAAYDKPVTWADMSNMDLTKVFESQYASPGNLMDALISESAMSVAMMDADSRISQEFHVPAELKESVYFWLKIYTAYTTQHVVIFDEKHPEIVYEVLDFRELAKTSRNRMMYEINLQHKVKKTVRAYRAAYQHLISHPGLKNPTEIEKNILAGVAKIRHKHSLRELARSVRTQTGQRDNIIKGLLAAEAFFPKMEQIFKKMEVPLELTRLSLVESSFNLNAISRVGASGVWQFMRKSAKEYMRVDETIGVDERLSPLKSTLAAAKLLKRNYHLLRSWPLAVTSYNHGTRGLRVPAGDKTFARVAHVFSACDHRSRLGWASRNYYSEFLAVVHAEAYRHLFYGEAPVTLPPPITFVRITPGKTGLDLALEKGVSLQEFRFLNPDILYMHRKLPKNFLIALPGDHDDLVSLFSPRLGISVRRKTRHS